MVSIRLLKRTSLSARSKVTAVISLTLLLLYIACTRSNINTGNKSKFLSTASSFEDHMNMYRNRYKYQPPSTPHSNDELCGRAPDFQTYFSKSLRDRSANDEDKTIYTLFFKEDKNNATPTHDTNSNANVTGTVVEMGAFNGVQESNSRFFDDCLGWETLLVEGNPRKYDELVINRPHAHRFNYVPSCTEEEEVAEKTILFDRAIHTNAGLADGSVETSYTHDNVTGTSEVPCGGLTKVLLDIFPNGHVSFFSLDVEGSEPSIVRELDFDRVYIEIMMIETFNNFCPKVAKCESRDEYRKIMREAGYIMFENMVQKSDLFIHPLSAHLETAKMKGFVPSNGNYKAIRID